MDLKTSFERVFPVKCGASCFQRSAAKRIVYNFNKVHWPDSSARKWVQQDKRNKTNNYDWNPQKLINGAKVDIWKAGTEEKRIYKGHQKKEGEREKWQNNQRPKREMPE